MKLYVFAHHFTKFIHILTNKRHFEFNWFTFFTLFLEILQIFFKNLNKSSVIIFYPKEFILLLIILQQMNIIIHKYCQNLYKMILYPNFDQFHPTFFHFVSIFVTLVHIVSSLPKETFVIFWMYVFVNFAIFVWV